MLASTHSCRNVHRNLPEGNDTCRLIFLQSMTIEEVLSVRKKQCTELLDVVARGVAVEVERPANAGDHWLAGRLAEAEGRKKLLAAADAEHFNTNTTFTSEVTAIIGLIPTRGDITAAINPGLGPVRSVQLPDIIYMILGDAVIIQMLYE